MSGRRGRRAVFAAPEQIPEPVAVSRLGPVIFTVAFRDGNRVIDWSALPCPKLVRPLAGALRELGGENGTIRHWPSFLSAAGWVRDFVRMVAAGAGPAADAFTLADLTASHLDAFEEQLTGRYQEGSRSPYLAMGYLVRTLRRVNEDTPGQLAPGLVARIAFTSAQAEDPPSTPLDAYPQPVFGAITAAALSDVQAIARRITDGEALAARGQDPEAAGWDDLANAAWYVSRHGPLTGAHSRMRHGPKIQALGGIGQVNQMLYLTFEDLVPLLVAAICLTGLEPECAKDLRADCLASPARGFVSVRYVKRRARGRENKSMRVSDGGSLRHPGGLIRLALRLTQRGRELIGSSALWVDVTRGKTSESFATRRLIWRHFAGWMRRHGLDQLTDGDGSPVRLHLVRLRKSWKSAQYLRAGGVIADFASGHTAEVAAGHYADIGAHRDIHEQAVEDGLRQAMAVAQPPVVIDEHGARLDGGDQELPPAQVKEALSGSSDVFLASCSDFFDTPFAAKGKPCPVAMWGCLDCANAVFTTRHLPQVLAFLAFIEAQREEYTVAGWGLRYGRAFERIVTGIRGRFTPAQIATAQAIAEGGGARLLLPPQFTGGLR